MVKAKPIPSPEISGTRPPEPPMSPTYSRGARTLMMDALMWASLGVAATVALILHLLHACSRDPNFDEHVILQFTWLVSQGLMPRVDFLCPYPTTGFLFFSVLLNHLPQEPSLFIGLRIMTLIPLLLFLAGVGLIARSAGRSPTLVMMLALMAIAAGHFPTLWEIRFDLPAWSLSTVALGLLLYAPRALPVAMAASLSVLALMISPKNALIVLGMALGFGMYALKEGKVQALKLFMAAAGGAAAALIGLTLWRPSIVPDSLHLTLMNFRAQQGSVYPVSLFESLFGLLLDEPWIALAIVLGPVLFALRWRHHERHMLLTLSGVAMGILVTMFMLPCGYPQYVSLIWIAAAAFLPWLTPAPGSQPGRVIPAVVMAAVALAMAIQEIPHWSARPLLTQIRLQEDLASFCPPGETAVAAPFTHPWFRRNPGYVFIDNDTSYRHSVRKERQHFFTADYFYDRLKQKPPAYICGFNMADNAPKEYQNATIRFLIDHQANYIAGSIPYSGHKLLPDGRMPIYIRSDIAGRMGGIPVTNEPPH